VNQPRVRGLPPVRRAACFADERATPARVILISTHAVNCAVVIGMSKIRTFAAFVLFLFLIITSVNAKNFSGSQIVVFTKIVLAKVTIEHCPEYQFNRANVMKEMLRVRLKDEDFVGRKFDIAKDGAEKIFARLSKHLSACRYLYMRMSDTSNFPVLEENVRHNP
jgi:hypothetical protein